MDYSRHLLIDAYNVIHQWPDLRHGLRRGSGFVRDALAGAVRILHDRERIRVTLVFDGRGRDLEIERLVGRAPDPESCLVVTQDLAERQTVEALGASALSPDELHDWILRVEKAVARDLAEHQREVDSRWKK